MMPCLEVISIGKRKIGLTVEIEEIRKRKLSLRCWLKYGVLPPDEKVKVRKYLSLNEEKLKRYLGEYKELTGKKYFSSEKRKSYSVNEYVREQLRVMGNLLKSNFGAYQ